MVCHGGGMDAMQCAMLTPSTQAEHAARDAQLLLHTEANRFL